MVEIKSSAKKRLKQQDLVMIIFRLFADEYENSNAKSIWDIKLPIDQIKTILKERHNVSYRSNLWIYTQLKRYEEDSGVRLFKKEQKGKNNQSFNLSIYDSMLTFTQKQHLYVTGKIKIANGVNDKIRNSLINRPLDQPLTIMLGAGSSIYHVADILAEHSRTFLHQFRIYTHNLGVIQRLLAPDVDTTKFELYTPSGRIDPVTYCVVSQDSDFYETVPFDFIIQGTSVVHNGNLYIESGTETNIKEAILHHCRGEKILILTKHECKDQPLSSHTYGKISDYDFLIVPRFQKNIAHKKNYEEEFEQYRENFTPIIMNWNYEILAAKR